MVTTTVRKPPKFICHPYYGFCFPAEEFWRDVVGFEGLYQYSSHGQFRSLDRTTDITYMGKPCKRSYKGKVLSQTNHNSGYFSVTLSKSGRMHTFLAHQLILASEVGPAPIGMEACHQDGNKKNNRLENLRWGTRHANIADRILHGGGQHGEKNHRAKITETDVVEMRRLYATGNYTMKKIGGMFGLTELGALQVIRGITWKHVRYLPNPTPKRM